MIYRGMLGIASISDAFTNLEDGPHVHDADEIIGFFGNDPSNPHDLGGELKWFEEETGFPKRSPFCACRHETLSADS